MRARSRITATLAALAVLATTLPIAHVDAAIGGTRVVLRSPFDGGHVARPVEGTGWDLPKAPGATVYANLIAFGAVTFRTGTFTPSRGGGTTVPITVLREGTVAGTISFQHLRNLRVAPNREYPTGTALGMLGTGNYPTTKCPDGTADGWPYSADWTVCTPSAVYTHIEIAHGCHATFTPGTAIGTTPAVVMLSSAYPAGNATACDPAESASVNSDIEDGDEDGVLDHEDACISTAGFRAWRGCLPQLLRNPSFERPMVLTDPREWNPVGGTHVERRTYYYSFQTKEGLSDAAMSVSAPGGSLHQDLPIRTVPGQSYTFSLWIATEFVGTTASGSIVLWGTGGPIAVPMRTRFTTGSAWTLVTVTHDVRSWHTGLRAEVVLDTPGVTVLLDAAEVTRSLLRNGSFEEGTSVGWSPAQTTTNLASYTGNAKDGTRYGALNVAIAGGAVVQEVGEMSRAGQSYTFSVWVRTKDSRPVSGVLRLSAAGTTPILGVDEPFTAGPRWSLVSVTYDASQSRSFMRARLSLTTTGRTLLFDGGQMVRSALRNGSLEEGTTAGWRTANSTGGITSLTARHSVTLAKEGGWYASLATNTESGSAYQDLALVPRVGQAYTLSFWVRKPGTGNANCVVVLRARGGTTERYAAHTFWVEQEWTLVSVTLDVRAPATSLRAQLIVYTPGVTINFDEALLSPGTNRA